MRMRAIEGKDYIEFKKEKKRNKRKEKKRKELKEKKRKENK